MGKKVNFFIVVCFIFVKFSAILSGMKLVFKYFMSIFIYVFFFIRVFFEFRVGNIIIVIFFWVFSSCVFFWVSKWIFSLVMRVCMGVRTDFE